MMMLSWLAGYLALRRAGLSATLSTINPRPTQARCRRRKAAARVIPRAAAAFDVSEGVTDAEGHKENEGYTGIVSVNGPKGPNEASLLMILDSASLTVREDPLTPRRNRMVATSCAKAAGAAALSAMATVLTLFLRALAIT